MLYVGLAGWAGREDLVPPVVLRARALVIFPCRVRLSVAGSGTGRCKFPEES